MENGWTRDRTGDTRIFSPLLYLLSYPAAFSSEEGEIKLKMKRLVKRLVSKISESDRNGKVQFLDNGHGFLKIILGFARNADLAILDLGLHFEFHLFDGLDDFPGRLLFQALDDIDLLACPADTGRFYFLVIEILEREFALGKFSHQDLVKGLELKFIGSGKDDLVLARFDFQTVSLKSKRFCNSRRAMRMAFWTSAMSTSEAMS
jgi:hypothetical protein